MPLYENVFIARQDLTVDDVDNLVAKFSKIISDHNGKVVGKEYWGLRNLAYPIKKNVRGHYVMLNINSSFEAVEELKRVIKYNEDIIRNSLFVTPSHLKQTSIFVSANAKDYNAAKKDLENAPNPSDSIIEKLQFDF